jgi:hypothetical protein
MTVCPIAIVSGCKKCPVFGICPLKTVLGDHRPEDAQKSASQADAAKIAESTRKRRK